MQKYEKMAPQLSLIKIPVNITTEFELNKTTDWVGEILNELNENATDKTPEAYFENTMLDIFGEMTKKDKPDMGEFLLLKGHIEATYETECVRTLKPMRMDLDIPFKVCFIDETLAETELFKDMDETWVENEVYELYFYTKRTVDFKEMIHEQIFLHYNQYPILDADSKLPHVESNDPT